MNNTAFNLFADKVKSYYLQAQGQPDAPIWRDMMHITEEVKNELEAEAKLEPIKPTLADVHIDACRYAQLSSSFDRDEEQHYQPNKLAVYDAFIAGWKANY